ncbi:MAG: hypothetical protein Q7T51_03780 [Candidatus Moranbacteria bacterium]|nr:hypothetical protein [Candidatus Moranbacteria bacterium]
MKTNKKIVGAMTVFVMSFAVTSATCSAEDVVTTDVAVNNIASNAGISYSRLNLTDKIVSSDIKNSTITGADIKRGAVSSGDIKNRTIASIDIEKGAIKSGSIADDSIGNDKLKEDAVTSDKIQDGAIVTGDIATDTILAGNIATGAIGTAEILDGTILDADISPAAAIAYSKLLFANNIVAGDIATGAVATDEILDGTILTGDIAADTILAGNIATGAIGTAEILDGTILGSDIANTTIAAANIVADTIDGAQLADTITLDANLVLNGANVTGNGTLGEVGSRWSTIYADTLNYSSAIADDNSANTTVAFGDNSTSDAVNITANTTITDAEWSISNAGVATFASIDGVVGSITPAAGSFTTLSATGALTTGDITAYGATANNNLTVNGKGTGSVNLGDADSDVSVINALTIGNSATITAGGLIITAGGLDMTGDSITNVTQVGDSNDNLAITGDDWDVTNGGVATFKGLTSTSAVDLDGASSVSVPAATLGGACSVSGAIGVNPAGNAGERIMVCNGANWLAN